MRKFRFIGDPGDWGCDLQKNKIYSADMIVTNGYDDEFGYDWVVLRCAENNPEDWEEVFDKPKKLHKDTDLGYFSGLALQAILSNPNTAGQIRAVYGNVTAEKADEIVSKKAITIAKELIKQLDQEQHAL
jgi:spermidine/putrescine-binding protein